MKSSIIVSLVLIIVLSIDVNTNANAQCRNRCRHRYREVVREYYQPEVIYDRPVVTYVHNRHFHPTPYCSQPVVFAREYRTTPWYYVRNRREHENRAYEHNFRGGRW